MEEKLLPIGNGVSFRNIFGFIFSRFRKTMPVIQSGATKTEADVSIDNLGINVLTFCSRSKR
jgi:hypothetical protein